MADEDKPVVAEVSEAEGKRSEQQAEAETHPRCPFCGMDPLLVHIDDVRNEVQGGSVVITRTVLCRSCRAPLPIFVLGQEVSSVDPRRHLRFVQ